MSDKVFLKRKTVFHFLIGLGISLSIMKSCTSPDAVYASIQDLEESRKTISEMGMIYNDCEQVIYPDEFIEQDGKQYRLISAELKEVPVEGTLTYVSAVVPYELEGELQPPDTTVVNLLDEQTDETYQRELECLGVEEKDVIWKDTFEFPITVSGIDADSFWLGDIEIPADSDLSAYGPKFLEMLGLSEEYYHVDLIEWSGDRYERNGEIYRDAIGKGKKRIRFVDVTYGGQIRTPDTVGYRYESIYEETGNGNDKDQSETESSLEKNNEESQNASGEEGSFLEQLKKFVQEHQMVVSVSFLFILTSLVCLMILFFAKSKTKKLKSRD